MANPQAVMRAAQAGPMGGYDDGMDRPAGGQENGPATPKPPAGGQEGDALGGMMQALQGVGEFLKSQGPGAQASMGHFKALLQSMAQLGQEAPAPEMGEEPKAPGRIHESQNPGVQVL